MKRYFAVVCILVSAFCWAKDASKTEKWQANMKQLSRLLPQIVADVSTASRFYAPETLVRVKKNAKQLTQLAHKVKMGARDSKTTAEPGMEFLAQYLEDETLSAYQAIESGHLEYARNALKGVAGYCIACHSRNSTGKALPAFELTVDSSGLSAMEKAELAAATRQFDRALKEFGAIAKNESFAQKEPLVWWRAVKYYMGISIRYKGEPQGALDLVNSILKFKSTPILASRHLKAWKASLEGWSKEGSPKLRTEKQKLSYIRTLFKAGSKRQAYPADHAADVEYLRLTSVAHEFLQSNPKSSAQPEVLYLTGQAYEALEFPDLWSVHERYYEQCIRLSPKTDWSKKCYHRLEDSLVAGYSGSGGVAIPLAAQKRLKALREIAGIK